MKRRKDLLVRLGLFYVAAVMVLFFGNTLDMNGSDLALSLDGLSMERFLWGMMQDSSLFWRSIARSQCKTYFQSLDCMESHDLNHNFFVDSTRIATNT